MKVELRNINKHFGLVHANNDVSLPVAAGTIHGLLGENGAGKSTLVKILSGFITRDSGDIVLDGQATDIRTPADAMRYRIGMLHQDPLDFPPLPVIENFMAGTPTHGPSEGHLPSPASGRNVPMGGGQGRGFLLNTRSAEQAFKSLGAQFNFDIDPRADAGDLTVGERQQLEILRLLACGVGTLILDEPTTGISASQKTLLFEALRKLAKEGRSIIFVSHKLEDVEALCDEVTVMRRGQVVGNLDLREARRAPDGHLSIASRIVALMFGKALALPIKPATRTDEIALHLDNLTLQDDQLTIDLGTLAVRRGEVIGIAGLEGSGQQAFLLACSGLQAPASGTVRLGDLDFTHKPYPAWLEAGVSYVPADRLRDGLIAGLTIQDHFALRSSNKGGFVNSAETLALAEQAIATFNIRGKPDTPVERLSGGNQQRTELALMPTPLTLVLMEHPTRGLDIESTLYIWQQLSARCQQGTAIIFASSDLDEIMQYSDRVIVFSGGHVSAPLDTASLTADQLGQMIGGKF